MAFLASPPESLRRVARQSICVATLSNRKVAADALSYAGPRRKRRQSSEQEQKGEEDRCLPELREDWTLGTRLLGTSEGQSRSGDEPGRYDAARGTIVFIVYLGESSSAAHNQR